MPSFTQFCAGAIVCAALVMLPSPGSVAETLLHFDTAAVGTPPTDCAAG